TVIGPVAQDGRGDAVPLQRKASSDRTSSGQIATQDAPGYVMSPRVVDFADRSDSPSSNDPDGPDTRSLENCEHAGAWPKNACEDTPHSHKAGKIDHC